MPRFSAFGHDLDWEERGEGRPLVFLHGLATDRRIMQAACDGESSRFRRLYLDLPGHGASKGNPDVVCADDLVAVVAEWVAHVVGGETPALVGYAYGGYLAQGLLRRLTPAALFLVCPTVEADFGRRTVPPKRVVRRDDELAFSTDPREREAFEEVAVIQTAEQLRLFQELIHPANIVADQTVLSGIRARYAFARPYAQALGAFGGPVSIVCGRHDHWVGWQDAVKLARVFDDVRVSVLPRCGHLLPLEAPHTFKNLYADWLGGLG